MQPINSLLSLEGPDDSHSLQISIVGGGKDFVSKTFWKQNKNNFKRDVCESERSAISGKNHSSHLAAVSSTRLLFTLASQLIPIELKSIE